MAGQNSRLKDFCYIIQDGLSDGEPRAWEIGESVKTGLEASEIQWKSLALCGRKTCMQGKAYIKKIWVQDLALLLMNQVLCKVLNLFLNCNFFFE